MRQIVTRMSDARDRHNFIVHDGDPHLAIRNRVIPPDLSRSLGSGYRINRYWIAPIVEHEAGRHSGDDFILPDVVAPAINQVDGPADVHQADQEIAGAEKAVSPVSEISEPVAVSREIVESTIDPSVFRLVYPGITPRLSCQIRSVVQRVHTSLASRDGVDVASAAANGTNRVPRDSAAYDAAGTTDVREAATAHVGEASASAEAAPVKTATTAEPPATTPAVRTAATASTAEPPAAATAVSQGRKWRQRDHGADESGAESCRKRTAIINFVSFHVC